MSTTDAIASENTDPLQSFLARFLQLVQLEESKNSKQESSHQQQQQTHITPDITHKLIRLKKCLSASSHISTEFTDDQLIKVLSSSFANKDVNKAFTFFVFLCLSNDNQLITNHSVYKHNYIGIKSNDIKLSGMDNWNNVLCYFDSLLFAMFAKLDDYDSSLLISSTNDSPLIKEFKLVLRFMVNLMRSGEATITTDIVQVFCKIFADLGFEEAISKKQQDVVSCFEIMCDYLSVPMLTLKIDIIHSGKVDLNDDLKYMNERVLFISVPEDKVDDLKNETIQEEEEASNNNNNNSNHNNSNNKSFFSKKMKTVLTRKEKDDTINLESCLNSYFNNTVKVKRLLERRRTLTLDHAALASQPQLLQSTPSPQSTQLSPQGSQSTVLQDQGMETSSLMDDVSIVDRDLLSDEDVKERNEFLGIVSANNTTEIVEPMPLNGRRTFPSTTTRGSHQSVASLARRSTENTSPFSPGSPSDDPTLLTFSSNGSSDLSRSPTMGKDHMKRSISSPLSTRHRRRDSMSKINEIITATRSRSSTDASQKTVSLIKRSSTNTLTNKGNADMEVTLPAWMFLQLLPYYSDFGSDDTDDLKEIDKGRPRFMSDDKATVDMVEDTRSPVVAPANGNGNDKGNDNDDDGFVESFNEKLTLENPIRNSYQSKRPIVPICLKRYIYNESGKTQKINKKFIIPTVLDMPFFVAGDRQSENNNKQTNRAFDRFRLVLESCVCHRGNSVESGHYIAASRKYPYVATDNKKDKDEERPWLLFNDMKDEEEKICEKTFQQILDSEAPYLLFYRIEDYETEPIDNMYGTPISKVETTGTMATSNSTVVTNNNNKSFLNKISNNSIADVRDLRKNSIISNVSKNSSRKDDDLRHVSSIGSTSTAGTMAPPLGIQPAASQAALAQPSLSTGIPKGSTESVPQEDKEKDKRHSHHTFSFTRSLSRSSSRPASKKDNIAPDSLEFIEPADRFFWYYERPNGTFAKQSKHDDDRSSFPLYNTSGHYRVAESISSEGGPPSNHEVKTRLSSMDSTRESKQVSIKQPQPQPAIVEKASLATSKDANLATVPNTNNNNNVNSQTSPLNEIVSPVSTKTIKSSNTHKDVASPKSTSHKHKHRLNKKKSHGSKQDDDKCLIM